MQLQGRLHSIECFRCILMLLIFLEHYPHSPIRLGGFAVCFFFMLSGFVLSCGYQDKILTGTIKYKDFIAGRVVKIYILHWLLLPVGFYIHRDIWGDVSKYLVANIFLLQSWIPDHYSYYSGNGVSWFLSTLLFCYIIYPFLIKRLSVLHLKGNMIICILLFFVRIALEYIVPQDRAVDWLYISPFTRWIDFCMGILVYSFYRQLDQESFNYNVSWLKCRISLDWFVMLCLLAFAYLFSMTCLWWILFYIIMKVLLDLENHIPEKYFSNRIFGIISLYGKISFTFYLIHQLYILILYNHFPVNQINSEIGKFAIIFFSCVMVSYMVHSYIEQPMYRRFKSFLYCHL